MGATVGLYLLDRLYELGVHHIFGIPGDYVIRFNKLIEQHKIQFINTTRENTAGYMADAYARLRGLGVACVTYGVGINIVNATAQAYVESSPLVIISGGAASYETGSQRILHHQINKAAESGFDLTQYDIFKKITVDQARLSNPMTAAADIERVLQACLRHKKPVYIELPRDQVEQPIYELTHPQQTQVTDAEALREALDEVELRLSASHRPMIWAGHELRIRRLAEPLLRFAERYQIPIVSTLLGKTVIDEHHPLFLGLYQGDMSLPEVRKAAEECDLGILLGLMFTDIDTGLFTANLGHDRQILAYPTTVTIGHHQFKNVRLEEFVEGLSKLQPSRRFSPPQTRPTRERFEPIVGAKTTTKRIFDCIQSHLRVNDLFVSDIGDCLFGATDLVLGQDTFLACSLFATLGFAVPGAIGASFAIPERRVIAVVGDGAFQMTATELATAVYYGLSPIIILLNNHGYGMERPLLEGRYNDILNWNYAELPKVFGGGVGVRVTTEDAFQNALTEAFARKGQFSLIEVELDKMDFSPAMHRFGTLFTKTIA